MNKVHPGFFFATLNEDICTKKNQTSYAYLMLSIFQKVTNWLLSSAAHDFPTYKMMFLSKSFLLINYDLKTPWVFTMRYKQFDLGLISNIPFF